MCFTKKKNLESNLRIDSKKSVFSIYRRNFAQLSIAIARSSDQFCVKLLRKWKGCAIVHDIKGRYYFSVHCFGEGFSGDGHVVKINICDIKSPLVGHSAIKSRRVFDAKSLTMRFDKRFSWKKYILYSTHNISVKGSQNKREKRRRHLSSKLFVILRVVECMSVKIFF